MIQFAREFTNKKKNIFENSYCNKIINGRIMDNFSHDLI